MKLLATITVAVWLVACGETASLESTQQHVADRCGNASDCQPPNIPSCDDFDTCGSCGCSNAGVADASERLALLSCQQQACSDGFEDDCDLCPSACDLAMAAAELTYQQCLLQTCANNCIGVPPPDCSHAYDEAIIICGMGDGGGNGGDGDGGDGDGDGDGDGGDGDGDDDGDDDGIDDPFDDDGDDDGDDCGYCGDGYCTSIGNAPDCPYEPSTCPCDCGIPSPDCPEDETDDWTCNENGWCEPWLGEDIDNCPFDCAPLPPPPGCELNDTDRISLDVARPNFDRPLEKSLAATAPTEERPREYEYPDTNTLLASYWHDNNRYVGHPLHVPDLIRIGMLSGTTLVKVHAFNAAGAKLEVGVIGNGSSATYELRGGRDCAWDTLVAEIPTRELAFPSERGARARNFIAVWATPREGTTSTGPIKASWMTATFAAQAPVVFVHGINDNSTSWGLWNEKIVDLGIQASADLYLGGHASVTDATGFVHHNESSHTNSQSLSRQLPGIARSFGTTDVHLVAHSKGGLDSVVYLDGYYPLDRAAGDVRVLSLTTLASPLHGSAAADVFVALRDQPPGTRFMYDASNIGRKQVVNSAVYDYVSAWCTWFESVGCKPSFPGLADLATTSATINNVVLRWANPEQVLYEHPTTHETVQRHVSFFGHGFDADWRHPKCLPGPGQPPSNDIVYDATFGTRINKSDANCIVPDELEGYFGRSDMTARDQTWHASHYLYQFMAQVRSVQGTASAGYYVVRDQQFDKDGTGMVIPIENDLVVTMRSARHPRHDSFNAWVGAGTRSISYRTLWNDRVERCREGANHNEVIGHTNKLCVLYQVVNDIKATWAVPAPRGPI